jgi:hypothetical protein
MLVLGLSQLFGVELAVYVSSGCEPRAGAGDLGPAGTPARRAPPSLPSSP